MKCEREALVCPAQATSGVITAESSGESRSAQPNKFPLHTQTLEHCCGSWERWLLDLRLSENIFLDFLSAKFNN